jgi:hypothetical protein
MLERLPFVAKVYTSVRQLFDSMMAKKESTQRVVLIDFPIVGQKSIGFLTRTLSDTTSGKPLAAVLVPNAINPTSAFLQILPIERVIETESDHGTGDEHGLDGWRGRPETIQYSHAEASREPVSSAKGLGLFRQPSVESGGFLLFASDLTGLLALQSHLAQADMLEAEPRSGPRAQFPEK